MTEIITRPAHEQAALLAAGEISAVELAQAHLDQIEAINPALNAFLHVDADGALATAPRDCPPPAVPACLRDGSRPTTRQS